MRQSLPSEDLTVNLGGKTANWARLITSLTGKLKVNKRSKLVITIQCDNHYDKRVEREAGSQHYLITPCLWVSATKDFRLKVYLGNITIY